LRKLVISFLLMVLVLSLSGCMKVKYHITVNKDGSAKEVIEMGMQKELVGMSEANPIEETKGELKKKGYKIRNTRKDGYIGIIAEKDYDDISKVRMDRNPATEGFKIARDKGWFKTIYKINGSVDLTDLAENTSEDEFEQQINNMLLNQFEFDFAVTLPVKPKDNHNATDVKGKTLIWTMVPGEKNDVQMEIAVWNWGNIAITVLGILVVLALIVFTIRKAKTSTGESIQT
jgi:hypothetical protein